MSWTLFRYILYELLKFFVLAAGAMAGIMSFGSLLRPLTKQGLGLFEVLEVLVNLVPAMSTYTLPVAALFATTIVYGRLAADNELTAIRAAGMSYLSAAFPGIVLGFTVCFTSLYMLCFVVPSSTLRVERVIYSNFARVLATSIERTHEFEMDKGGPTLSALGAQVMPPDTNNPTQQTVVLDSPLVIDYTTEEIDGEKVRVPDKFYTARRATVRIKPLPETDEVEYTAQLDDGVTFPRRFIGAVTGGVESTQYGPKTQVSQLVEKTKFMDLRKLRSLYTDPGSSRRVREINTDVNQLLQRDAMLAGIQTRMKLDGKITFVTPEGEQYALIAPDCSYDTRKGEMKITPPNDSRVRMEIYRGRTLTQTVDARVVSLRLTPLNATHRIEIAPTFEDATVTYGVSEDKIQREAKWKRPFAIEMPDAITTLGNRSARLNMTDPTMSPDLRERVSRAMLIVHNEIVGELNSRAAFAISCLILVFTGVALGMMFRSGHFLTAFAISVIPAMICILLNVTGQHTLETVPFKIPPGWTNPLKFGLAMIWSGNVLVAVLCGVLYHRLRKQ